MSTVSENFRLSVVIPVFNEARTIAEVIARVRATQLASEILIVDDGSTDGTRQLLEEYATSADVRVILHDRNQGKGAALKTGFLQAAGDIVLVQDADLEYDPADYPRWLAPLLSGAADVVYGSRFLEVGPQSLKRSLHTFGNRFITFCSNRFTGLRLTDMETCYKVFRREILAQIAPHLVEKGFGIEPEITARLARLPQLRMQEVSISYAARGYAEGKKINARDALWALWCVIRY